MHGRTRAALMSGHSDANGSVVLTRQFGVHINTVHTCSMLSLKQLLIWRTFKHSIINWSVLSFFYAGLMCQWVLQGIIKWRDTECWTGECDRMKQERPKYEYGPFLAKNSLLRQEEKKTSDWHVKRLTLVWFVFSVRFIWNRFYHKNKPAWT